MLVYLPLLSKPSPTKTMGRSVLEVTSSNLLGDSHHVHIVFDSSKKINHDCRANNQTNVNDLAMLNQ